MFKERDLNGVFISIRSRLSKTVARIVPPSDIEDIVQETYVRVCQIENKQRIYYPRAFILKMAKNLAFDHVKRAEARLTEGSEDDTALDLAVFDTLVNEPYEQAASNNDFALFCEAVRLLPRQCRRTFVLKKVYGYSQKEIATRLDISQSTVEKHIATGIKRCALFMNKHTEYGIKVRNKLTDSSTKDSESSETETTLSKKG